MVGLMGVLTLVGTVVNNGILYVDGVNMMRRRMDVEDALIEAGKTRLRPILITTLTTVISMTPSALGFGGRSSVMMQGMALVIIGGLVASTILILVLMPVFYLIVYGTSKKNRRKRDRNIISGRENKYRKAFGRSIKALKERDYGEP